MSEQIETAEELDALPAGTVLGRIHPDGSGPNVYRLDPDMGWLMAAERVNAPSVDRVDWVGNDLGPLVVLYRPDAKPETAADVVEWAAEVMWGATCPDGLRAAMRPDTMVMARALAAAGLLRGTVAAEQREATREPSWPWPDGARVRFTQQAVNSMNTRDWRGGGLRVPKGGYLGPEGKGFTIRNVDDGLHDVILVEIDERWGASWLEVVDGE